ncbi:uncharacterized protein EV420DRAFT_1742872 [Desarmillaria tabescens]|uniref:Uncharacterized protein n=1 Tax=Armillaria tabescens TaxID=1929756 RepID=A0AA39NLE9_ARMTA|nr:uncharacterized protein EV420DRAFT_1742872 [Desarmillaria tabescens]KAK0467808.1 hypothetical protein EV420DRAFT_1742872 [Desarmillaria tabescens]
MPNPLLCCTITFKVDYVIMPNESRELELFYFNVILGLRVTLEDHGPSRCSFSICRIPLLSLSSVNFMQVSFLKLRKSKMHRLWFIGPTRKLEKCNLPLWRGCALSPLERSILAAGQEPTYAFLRVPVLPGIAVDKPTNERFLLLKIPVAIISASARRGRKWLLYVATAVSGTSGYLRHDGRDLQLEGMEEPVVENETYDFVAEGALRIADAQCGDTRTSINPEESWHHNRDMIASRDGGRCIIMEPGTAERMDGFSHWGEAVRWAACQAAHILPHNKGSPYIEAIIRARGLDERIKFQGGIDNEKNAMFINRQIHAKGLAYQTCAFFYVPNDCMTMEDVLYPEDHPPPILPESLQHTQHAYLQFQMLDTDAYWNFLDFMKGKRLWSNKFVRMPDDRSSFPPFFICHFHYGATALHLWLDEGSRSILNSFNSQQYYTEADNEVSASGGRKQRYHQSSVGESATDLVSWLWRANGATMEEDGVDDAQTIIDKEFRSDKREAVEKWCQETVAE